MKQGRVGLGPLRYGGGTLELIWVGGVGFKFIHARVSLGLQHHYSRTMPNRVPFPPQMKSCRKLLTIHPRRQRRRLCRRKGMGCCRR